MKYIKTITIDINKRIFETIETKSKDTARYLLFKILDNGVPLDLTGKTVRAYSSANKFNDLVIVDAKSGLCELKLTTGFLFDGLNQIELTIYEGLDTLSTMIFYINNIACLRDDAAIESTNEFSALTIALNKVEVLDKNLNMASTDLEKKYTTRLNGIESQLEENKTQINSLNGNKVDKVTGKGLSTNDYSNAEKAEVSRIKDKATKEELAVERARIDQLTKLEEGSTTGDAEIIDARIGANGEKYANVGGAIRGQVGYLNETIANLESNLKVGEKLELADFQLVNDSYCHKDTGAVGDYSGMAYGYLPVNSGEKYYVSCRNNGNPSIAFYSTDVIGRLSFMSSISNQGVLTDYEITIPDGCVTLAVSTYSQASNPVEIKVKGNVLFNAVDNAVDNDLKLNDIYDILYSVQNRIGFSFSGMDKGKVIFMFDDALANTSDLYTMFHNYNIPMSMSVPTNTLNNIANDGRVMKDVLLDIQKDGGEILSHSTNGTVFTDISYDECEYRLRTSKETLIENGFVINGFVSPNGKYNSVAQKLYPKYYRYGYECAEVGTKMEQFRMERFNMPQKGIDFIKGRIDYAETNNDVIILFAHMNASELETFTMTDLETIIQYAMSKNVNCTTYKDCFYRYASISI